VTGSGGRICRVNTFFKAKDLSVPLVYTLSATNNLHKRVNRKPSALYSIHYISDIRHQHSQNRHDAQNQAVRPCRRGDSCSVAKWLRVGFMVHGTGPERVFFDFPRCFQNLLSSLLLYAV
jgi:hypothetical protein